MYKKLSFSNVIFSMNMFLMLGLTLLLGFHKDSFTFDQLYHNKMQIILMLEILNIK